MILKVLGRIRYYYPHYVLAYFRRLRFKLQGLDAIITKVHIKKDGTTKSFYYGMNEETEPPEDVLYSGWYRVIPYHPTEGRGVWSRSCS